MLGRLNIGQLCGFGIAHSILCAAYPIASAPKGYRRGHGCAEPLEMIQSQLRFLQIRQRQIPRQPLQIRVRRPLSQLMHRGQIIGQLCLALAHLRSCQRAPPTGPFVRSAQSVFQPALCQDQGDRGVGFIVFDVAVEIGIGDACVRFAGLGQGFEGLIKLWTCGFGQSAQHHQIPLGLGDQRQHQLHVL